MIADHEADIVDEREETCVIELLGNSQKINALVAAMDQFKLMEVVRSGVSSIARGREALRI